MPDDVSICIYSHYRRAFAFSSIPSLHCYGFSLRITFLEFLLGAIQGLQAQHEKVYWVRHALSTERSIDHEAAFTNLLPTSVAFWLQCVNHLHCSMITVFITHLHNICHTSYLALTQFMVTRRVVFSRFLPRIEILRYIVRPALYSGS